MPESSRVAILMATYNGQDYIGQQIESIQNQTFEAWELFIRDDGSSDETIKLVKQYSSTDERIHLIDYNYIIEHGACLNFYNLLQYAKLHINEFEYYFLCDQDDIWKRNKLQSEIDEIKKYHCPALVYSDLELMSENGKSLQIRVSDSHNIDLTNPNDIYFNQIFVWGNTICINKDLLALIEIPSNISNNLSHDHYLAFYAISFGKCIYLNEALVLYRRHSANVSGLPPKYNIIDIARRTILKSKDVYRGHIQSLNNVLYFIDNAPYKTTIMLEVENAIRHGRKEAANLLKKYNIRAGSNKPNEIVTKVILFTRWYGKSIDYEDQS